MHWHFCTQNRSSLFIWLIDTIIVYNFYAGETNTKTFCLPKNKMSIWIWFTYRISRFEKLSYTTKSFQSHSTKFASKTWLSVWEIRIWTFGLNSSSDFRLATRHFISSCHLMEKLKFIPGFHNQGNSNVQAFYKFVWGRVVCQWNLVSK